MKGEILSKVGYTRRCNEEKTYGQGFDSPRLHQLYNLTDKNIGNSKVRTLLLPIFFYLHTIYTQL